MIITIIATFAFGLLPYIDNYAHLGGFITGIFLGILIVLNIPSLSLWKRRTGFIIRAIGGLLFLATFIGLFLVLYLVKEPVSIWCSGCKYFNCIPNIKNGIDWCGPI